jgi:GNAT superfamily N-acetyltransferase
MQKELPGGYRISDDLSPVDFVQVTQWLSGTYWTPGIGQAEVEKSARGSSLVMGAYAPGGEQAGYARLVSDKTRFAYVLDVFVGERHRKKGLAGAMILFAREHPDYRTVYQWLLATRDAHELYRKAGFGPLRYPDRWMEINRGRPQ